jgi:hypothetical protein
MRSQCYKPGKFGSSARGQVHPAPWIPPCTAGGWPPRCVTCAQGAAPAAAMPRRPWRRRPRRRGFGGRRRGRRCHCARPALMHCSKLRTHRCRETLRVAVHKNSTIRKDSTAMRRLSTMRLEISAPSILEGSNGKCHLSREGGAEIQCAVGGWPRRTKQRRTFACSTGRR